MNFCLLRKKVKIIKKESQSSSTINLRESMVLEAMKATFRVISGNRETSSLKSREVKLVKASPVSSNSKEKPRVRSARPSLANNKAQTCK